MRIGLSEIIIIVIIFIVIFKPEQLGSYMKKLKEALGAVKTAEKKIYEEVVDPIKKDIVDPVNEDIIKPVNDIADDITNTLRNGGN